MPIKCVDAASWSLSFQGIDAVCGALDGGWPDRRVRLRQEQHRRGPAHAQRAATAVGKFAVAIITVVHS